MQSPEDSFNEEDLNSRQVAVLVFGILAVSLGVACIVNTLFCASCNVVAPFACLVGGMALYQSGPLMKALAAAKVSDTMCLVGIILASIGLLMGLTGLLIMVIFGCCLGAYFGMVGLLILASVG